MLDSQAARTIVSNSMDTDLLIKNDTALKENVAERKNILDESLIKSIRETDGVSKVHSMIFTEITVPWEPDFAEMWMEEFYAKWMSIPYSKEKEEYQNHPEKFKSSLIGIGEAEFDYLNKSLEHPVKKEEFLSGKACIIYRNGLDFTDAELTGKKVTCTLYGDQQMTKTFTIKGITDESYYMAILGYPPTIITSDRVVRSFADQCITLKTSIKYQKEYDRNTEKKLLALLQEDENANDFSWESKIEEADEIRKAQGSMPQLGMGIVLILALIGIMNYMNNFVANVQNRMIYLFGDGKHWNDSETAFGNAYKGRTLLCMWCMGCYIDSRNGSNLFSLSVNELPWSCVFNSTDADPAGSAGKFSDRCFSSCIYMDGFGKKWYGC